ncbi:MAG: calcium-translocating P-type ATPase, PMCA-type [Clostridia bacterium]|nr:calcium-translocating P-type ATPase, PMCA-type [Clostridia bacterium]MDD4375598.1 calcium-translocating P-type ATPase, PMCA-type [Clostridia bacterium]
MEKEIYNLSKDETLDKMQTRMEGLSNEEAEKRIERDGENKLLEGKRKTLITKLLEQFKDVMVIILFIASIVSGIVAYIEKEPFTDSIIILIVVFLNAVMGVIQESKAEKAIDSLKKMSTPFIRVKRDGKVLSINIEALVVGDIVLVEAGDFVPADMRIIENSSLRVEEAALTGESLPIDKYANTIDGSVPLAERKNMLYSGCGIVYGRGTGVVVATGMNTELGKIANVLTEHTSEFTPLQKKMNEISKTLSIIVVVIGLIMVTLGVFREQPAMEVFMLAVSLAVAAIPEGLPAAITIILSIGVQKMAKENSVVRKLSSVEALGSTEIICSDKTGTLTQNKMAVKEICIGKKILEEVTDKQVKSGDGLELINAMILCNDTKYGETDDVLIGDPTETALVAYAQKFNIKKAEWDSKFERKEELPFDSERKMMSTINKTELGYKVYTKGAIETIIARCDYAVIDGQKIEMTIDIKKEILNKNHDMSKKALRVLAFAMQDVKAIPEKIESSKVEKGMTYIGLVGMIDPPRPEAKEAVKDCYEAGMLPVMITGDNIETAKAIATELGIITKDSLAITGMELDQMSDDEFKIKIEKIRVYARVSPENKLRIVKMWKKLGKTVAMTGDGVNDAPALKHADIGVGMGITGTEVSKSVSSMVITDDNFATIVVAVKEGRRIYTNIQNVIAYLLASNLAEVIVIFVGMLFGHIVMLPLQLLWINLVTDTIPAITLGFEKAEKGIMKQKPRSSKEKFFNSFLTLRILIPAIIKSILILTSFFIVESKYGHAEAMTVAFIMMAFIELLFAHTMRSDRRTIKQIGVFSNKPMLLGTIITIALQLIVTFIPSIAKTFKVEQLSLELYMLCIGVAFGFVIIAEMMKVLLAKVYHKE